jgi:hypothetical protein
MWLKRKYTKEEKKKIDKKVDEAKERERRIYTYYKIHCFLNILLKDTEVDMDVDVFLRSNPWSYKPKELEDILNKLLDDIKDEKLKNKFTTLASHMLNFTSKEFYQFCENMY